MPQLPPKADAAVLPDHRPNDLCPGPSPAVGLYDSQTPADLLPLRPYNARSLGPCCLAGHRRGVWAVAMFTSDGRRVISGSDDGNLRFWDATIGVPLGWLRIGERTRSLTMLPDGNAFVSASREGWVRLWPTSSK